MAGMSFYKDKIITSATSAADSQNVIRLRLVILGMILFHRSFVHQIKSGINMIAAATMQNVAVKEREGEREDTISEKTLPIPFARNKIIRLMTVRDLFID